MYAEYAQATVRLVLTVKPQFAHHVFQDGILLEIHAGGAMTKNAKLVIHPIVIFAPNVTLVSH